MCAAASGIRGERLWAELGYGAWLFRNRIAGRGDRMKK